jgi:hypothetical protein
VWFKKKKSVCCSNEQMASAAFPGNLDHLKSVQSDLNDSIWRAYAKGIEEVHGFDKKADTKEAESKQKSLEAFKRHLKDVGLDYSDVKSVSIPKTALFADVSEQFKEKEVNNSKAKQNIDSKE